MNSDSENCCPCSDPINNINNALCEDRKKHPMASSSTPGIAEEDRAGYIYISNMRPLVLFGSAHVVFQRLAPFTGGEDIFPLR